MAWPSTIHSTQFIRRTWRKRKKERNKWEERTQSRSQYTPYAQRVRLIWAYLLVLERITHRRNVIICFSFCFKQIHDYKQRSSVCCTAIISWTVPISLHHFHFIRSICTTLIHIFTTYLAFFAVQNQFNITFIIINVCDVYPIRIFLTNDCKKQHILTWIPHN